MHHDDDHDVDDQIHHDDDQIYLDLLHNGPHQLLLVLGHVKSIIVIECSVGCDQYKRGSQHPEHNTCKED